MDEDPSLEAPRRHACLWLTFLEKPSFLPEGAPSREERRVPRNSVLQPGCISRIELDPRNPYLECPDGKALLRKEGEALFFSLGTIPEGTKKIESNAFPTGLRKKTLAISSSVEEMERGALNGVLVQTLLLGNPKVKMERAACASRFPREVRIQGKAPCLTGMPSEIPSTRSLVPISGSSRTSKEARPSSGTRSTRTTGAASSSETSMRKGGPSSTNGRPGSPKIRTGDSSPPPSKSLRP